MQGVAKNFRLPTWRLPATTSTVPSDIKVANKISGTGCRPSLGRWQWLGWLHQDIVDDLLESAAADELIYEIPGLAQQSKGITHC